jgi:hypothetical protein
MVRRSLLVVVAVAGCGVPPSENDVASLDNELVLTPKGVDVPDRDCRVVTVRPTASGTIRSAPGVPLLEVAPVGSAVQSMHFETSTYGAERRNGVVEFNVPALGGRIVSSTLRFTDRHGWQLQPIAEDLHRLSFYDADGVISAGDWVREGPVGITFTTDLNEMNPPERKLDVTSHVRAGTTVGARIELVGTSFTSGSYGSAFDGFRLELRLCGENALPNGVPTGDPE